VTACSQCGNDVQDNEEFCPVDEVFHGYPNVKMAERERADLRMRSQAARDALTRRGLSDAIAAIEAVSSETDAVVNVDPEFAGWFLTNDRTLYATYRRQVEAGARRPAAVESDQERLAVEARLFGSRSDVTYAALAAKGQGLHSYGIVALRLKRPAIEKRATLLEENSYAFSRRHPARLPGGHRAAWQDRAELLLAKLEPDIDDGWSVPSIRRSVLRSAGVRQTDDFIEVHIWRGFSPRSVAAIEVQKRPQNRFDRLTLHLARIKAKRLNLPWYEA
jgi:hypothetical protein